MTELIDEVGRQALFYVIALADQGYMLTVEEFAAYVAGPQRTAGRATPKRLIKELVGYGKALEQLASAFEYSPWEPVLDWLVRLRWLRLDGNHVVPTALGKALLAAVAASDNSVEPPTQISLAPGDELAYPRILSLITQAGHASLVDGFFRIDNLSDIIKHTQIYRILVKPDPTNVVALAAAVRQLNPQRSLAIRSSDCFHDRFIIPDSGKIRLVGTSLNGVGKRFAVTLELDEDAVARAVRGAFDSAWAQGTPVVEAGIPDHSAEDTQSVKGAAVEDNSNTAIADGQTEA